VTRGFYSYSLSIGLALAFAGFPLGAAIAKTLDLNNTMISITVRTTIAFIAMFFFLKFISEKKVANSVNITKLSIVFWALYLMRMFYDTVISDQYMFFLPYEYWIWAVGGSLVPMIGFAFVTGEERNGAAHFKWQFVFFLIAAILILLTASTLVQSEYGEYSTGRLNLSTLNPISLGHVGTSLFLLSFWALFCWNFPRNWVMIVVYIGASLLGLFLMISSNSRGPLVSLIVVLLVAILTLKTAQRLVILALSMIAAGTFVPIIIVIDALFETSIYNRLLGQSQLEEVNVIDRYDRYIVAMKAFADHPLVGVGLEVPKIGGYPHNVIVESFISVGLFGAIVFISLFVIISVKSFVLLNRDTGYGWLSLLFLQYAVGAQFSGSIHSSTTFWAAAGAMIAVAWPVTLRKSRQIGSSTEVLPLRNIGAV
jgi:O-antigen ligase